MSDSFLIDELLLTTDVLRSMLDDAQTANRLLRERISELEAVLVKHGVPIPDYDAWHNGPPVA